MNIFKLIYKNLKYNKFSTIIMIFVVMISVTLFTAIMSINSGIKEGTIDRIDNYDMLVGGAGSSYQLVLSTLYHYETPPGNIDYHIYQKIKNNDRIDNAVPLALGDNYANFRIVGTDKSYFNKYGDAQSIINEGQMFEELGEVIIGARVAEQSDLEIGDKFKGIHGLEATHHEEDDDHEHDEIEFTVTGVTEMLNNSDDYYIFTPYQTYWLLHGDEHYSHDNNCEYDHNNELTAVMINSGDMVGLSQLRNEIEDDESYQAQAVFLNQITRQMFNILDDGTQIARYIVYVSLFFTFLIIFISLMNTVVQKKKDLLIYRILGAPRSIIIKITMVEAIFTSIIGSILGSIAGFILMIYTENILQDASGVNISVSPMMFVRQQLIIFSLVIILTLLVSIISVYNVYKNN